MGISKQQQEVIDWALEKIQSDTSKIKYFNIVSIFLTFLDCIFSIISLIYMTMTISTVITSVLCGSAWASRSVQIIRMKKLIEALRLPTMLGITYIATRKKRSEFMQKIKIRNWIIAGLNAIAIILGVVLVFVEPNVLTNNIEAVICTLGGLLGVNIAIPCFNNAESTPEDKIKAQEAKVQREARKQVKAEQKAKEQELINAKIENIKIEKEKQQTEQNDATIA